MNILVIDTHDQAGCELALALTQGASGRSLVVVRLDEPEIIPEPPSSTMWQFSCFPQGYCDRTWWLMLQAENKVTHCAFLNTLIKRDLEARRHPNPLRIRMRALNVRGAAACRRLHRCIKQPCWRAGRWKSLT